LMARRRKKRRPRTTSPPTTVTGMAICRLEAYQPLARSRPEGNEHRPLAHRPEPPPHEVPSMKLD